MQATRVRGKATPINEAPRVEGNGTHAPYVENVFCYLFGNFNIQAGYKKRARRKGHRSKKNFATTESVLSLISPIAEEGSY